MEINIFVGTKRKYLESSGIKLSLMAIKCWLYVERTKKKNDRYLKSSFFCLFPIIYTTMLFDRMEVLAEM